MTMETASECDYPFQIILDDDSGGSIIPCGSTIVIYPFVYGHFDICLVREVNQSRATIRIVERINDETFLSSCDLSAKSPVDRFTILGGVVAFNNAS
jgi:hypothetical protein